MMMMMMMVQTTTILTMVMVVAVIMVMMKMIYFGCIIYSFLKKKTNSFFESICSYSVCKFKGSFYCYEGGSESSVIGVITLLIDMIGCCFIP